MVTGINIMEIVEALFELSMIVMVGLYFIFSNTIMRTLAMRSDGANVMNDINKDILNPIFLGGFVLSGVAGLYFLLFESNAKSVAGGIFFIGTTLVTVTRSVPLNNLLRDSSVDNIAQVWQRYLDKWVFWNHVRSASAIIAGFLLALD